MMQQLRARRIALRAAVSALLSVMLPVGGTSRAMAADQFFAGDGSALTAAKWAATNAGPFSSSFTTGNVANFAVANGTFTGPVSISVSGINATENLTPTGTVTGSTFATGGTVATVNVSDTKKLDFTAVTLSTAAGTGFIKDGLGEWLVTTGGTYSGGFTLRNGIMTVGGVNAMGGSATNTLRIEAGTLRTNTGGNRDFTGKFGGGITIAGDFTVGLAANAGNGNITFSDAVSLGNTTRTITYGSAGTTTFGGAISSTGGAGLTVTGSGAGEVDLTNINNSGFTGRLTVNGTEVRISADGTLGPAPSVNTDNITIDGGRLSTLSGSTFVLDAHRNILLGSTAGTSLSVVGTTGVLTYNGLLKDLSTGGTLVKQGAGTLAFGGTSSYTGNTFINNGTLQLTSGANRLPITGLLSIGQGASTNLGNFDMNGQSQEVAGLVSTAGTNATTTTNLVTSATAAILTISGSGTYVYSDGTAANSGVIGGLISLVKTGSGKETLGGANTYSGPTSITGGTLEVSSTGSLGSGNVTVSNGTLHLLSSTSISDAAQLALTTANVSIADLGAGVNEMVGALTLGGVTQAGNTTYGSTSSSAAVKDDRYFAGTGVLTVAPEPSGLAALSGLGLLLIRRRRARAL